MMPSKQRRKRDILNYKGYAKPDASEKQSLNFQSYRVSKSLHSVCFFSFVLLFFDGRQFAF